LLLQARRRGTLSPADADQLSEIETYIGCWERADEPTAGDDPVWERLNTLAGRLMGIQVEIERGRKE